MGRWNFVRGCLLLGLTLCAVIATPGPAYAYNGSTHRWLTMMAFELAEMTSCDPLYELRENDDLPSAVSDVDREQDLHLIYNVGSRDNSYTSDAWKIEDELYHMWSLFGKDYYFTAFNHFIDLQKGRGTFDDYDGYSFGRGSGDDDDRPSTADREVANLSAGWYVFHLGGQWYREYDPASPALDRYSFPEDDLGEERYESAEDELGARFPRAEYSSMEGYRQSVFLPVDNMARYWFARFSTEDKAHMLRLGYVLHAVQDASCPHHAAGVLGLGHSDYENECGDVADPDGGDKDWKAFVYETAGEYLRQWKERADAAPHGVVTREDAKLHPSVSWSIQDLVTWLAFSAYDYYESTSHDFLREEAGKLVAKGLAMTALVMQKAQCDPCARLGAGSTRTVRACTIDVGGDSCSYQIERGAMVEFVAGERIVLRPGFRAEEGAEFRARLE